MNADLYFSEDTVLIERSKSAFCYAIGPFRLYNLNKDGVRVLSLISKKNTLNEIASAIAGSKNENINKIQKVLKNFVNNLQNKGLLTSEKLTKSYSCHFRKIKTSPELHSVIFEVTRDCNLNCRHCYVLNKNSRQELTLSQIKDMINEATDLGVWQWSLTGGEPFYRNDILKIIEFLTQKLIVTNVFTNGTLLSKSFISSLKMLRIHSIIISLDGEQGFHNENKTFKQSMKVIEDMLSVGLKVKVNITLTRNNKNELPHLCHHLKQLKTPYEIGTIFPRGHGEKVQSLNLSEQQFGKLYKKYSYATDFYLLDSLRTDNVIDTNTPCGVGNKIIFISFDGSVSLCPSLTIEDDFSFFAGNVSEKSIKDIWEKSKTFKMYRDLNCSELLNCNVGSTCKGGCRSRAYHVYGDVTASDKVACAIYGRHEE